MRRGAAAWLVSILVATAASAAACGGGGGDDDAAPASTSVRDDQTVAQEANLRLSDFPTEWQATPVEASASAATVEANRRLADCMGRPRPEEIRTALADSDDFSARDTRRVTSSVQVVRTVQIAEDDFAALRTDQAVTCHKAQVDSEFARQLPPDASPQTTIERLTLPQFGEDTVAFRVAATTQNQGAQIRTYIDLVFLRKGRIELSASFINRETPFPGDLQRALLQRMVGRA